MKNQRIGKAIYGDFLVDNPDVIGKEPKLVKPIAEDVSLELYVADSGSGKNTWAIAVIAVNIGKYVYRTKYDGGRINNDLDVMADECLANIRFRWDLNMWRKWANEAVLEQRGWFQIFLERIKKWTKKNTT